MKRYILSNSNIEVHIADIGATIMKLIVKDIEEKPVDIILGFDEVEQYSSTDYLSNYPYFGALMGRCGGRIGNASFDIDGVKYQLSANTAPHHLHGGFSGFDRKIWSLVSQTDQSLELCYISPDGEEGYPGNLEVVVKFELCHDELKVSYKAHTDKKCPVSLTHHPYFNLCPSQDDIKRQQLRLFSDQRLILHEGIADGKKYPVEPLYEYNQPKSLRAVIEEGNSLDDAYVYDHDGEMKEMAEISHPDSSIGVAISSDYPSAVVYAGEYVEVKNGKGGRNYHAYAGLAIEPQYAPNTPNVPQFPSNILKPGQTYLHHITYRIFKTK